jgi:hypothetical protein
MYPWKCLVFSSATAFYSKISLNALLNLSVLTFPISLKGFQMNKSTFIFNCPLPCSEFSNGTIHWSMTGQCFLFQVRQIGKPGQSCGLSIHEEESNSLYLLINLFYFSKPHELEASFLLTSAGFPICFPILFIKGKCTGQYFKEKALFLGAIQKNN